MDVAQLVRFGKTFGKKILIGIVFRHFRGEGHHLPGRRVAAHVGIAQVHIVLVDGHDAVHHMFHLSLFVALGVSPLAIDDILLGNLRPYFHQFFLYQILNLFYGDGRSGELADYIHCDVGN